MATILTLISLLIIFMGGMMIYRPKAIPDIARLYVDETAFQVYASIGRILLGIALVRYADYSRLPMLVTILGTASLLSGIAFLFLSPEKFRDFIRTMLFKVDDLGIIPGIVVTIVGLILLYAVG
ncbi:MAG: Unknown protein [uncultured Thiotrichaceae bacterium]|uniref:Uncharacterized protein n=1 Tax=uncultured Thiotrichaceae bacterium TaxID=298394 RepID=A0A6S6T379_9GAMM|nr:MAG: Unknown protein [uncultured Thiotrichaceae bacterium]